MLQMQENEVSSGHGKTIFKVHPVNLLLPSLALYGDKVGP